MRLAELQQALQAVNPAAVLVSPRVVERVIEQVHNLPTLVWEVPHRRSCVVDRQVLFRHIEQEDLDLNPGQLLPSTVILLARPSNETLNSVARDILLVEYWRRLFHASIHHDLERRWHDKVLTLDDMRGRIEAIGASEFAEAEQVLSQENYLVPDAAEQEVYIEFAAVFLELRYFATNLLPVFFPAIRDPHRVEEVLAQDLDIPLLFARTRLPGAPDPAPATDTSSDESHDFFRKLARSAERAAEVGNTVRAAILRTRAARVAPGNLTLKTRAEAEGDLQRLTRRLEAALELTPAEGAEWARHLTELLDRADQGPNPVEADVLVDLQKACIDHEKDIHTVSVVDWALSAGKWPIKRPLPSLRLVRVGNHIQAARQRLTRARLSDTSRKHLLRLMDNALHRSEDRLRTRLRPVLEAALQDVGLEPANPPQRTAFEKIIEEILDRIIAHGFLYFSDLRDTLSRNDLKLPDVPDPRSFVRGDPLLRLDRRLAALLDGVYRPAEIYMRGLERVTSINFGTRFGRFVTRFITIPFGGAYLLLEVAKVILHLFLPHREEISLEAVGGVAGPLGAAAIEAAAQWASPLSLLPGILGWLLFLGLGFFLLGLMHWPALRARCAELGLTVWERVRKVIIDWPARLLRQEVFGALARSWPFQVFYWCLLTPTLLCLLLWRLTPERLSQWLFSSWPLGIATFVFVTMIVNTTFGRAFGETLMQGALKFIELLRAGLIPGLFRLVANTFKELVDALEYVLFSIDEWLRFRSGEGRVLLVLRTIVSALWFPISYLIRFYVVVLIEPGFNPIKAPISILFAKVMFPFWKPLTDQMIDFFEPAVGSVAAKVIAVPTVWLLPDALTFLFWELKENWSLYRANRPPTLRPAVIGSHGETLRGLLEPGFHSGTIPRLYSRLRTAERLASRTGTWQSARYYRHQLAEVAEALRLFVTRNLVNLVRQSRSWAGQSLHVGAVDLACSRVRVELTHDASPEKPAWLEFEERHSWILAAIPERGWIADLPDGMLRPLNNGLAGLYKLAGVDLVKEQARTLLPLSNHEYELTPSELVVWADTHHTKAIHYSLTGHAAVLVPLTDDGDIAPGWPELEATQLLFARVPLSWEQWVDCWQKEQEGREYPRLPGPAGAILPAQAPAGRAAERPSEIDLGATMPSLGRVIPGQPGA